MNVRRMNSILWMEEGKISHFKILSLVLWQLQTAHKLNLVMFNLVKFLTIECKAIVRPLSLHMKPCAHNKDLGPQHFKMEVKYTESVE